MRDRVWVPRTSSGCFDLGLCLVWGDRENGLWPSFPFLAFLRTMRVLRPQRVGVERVIRRGDQGLFMTDCGTDNMGNPDR
jgi:hypothetical protein